MMRPPRVRVLAELDGGREIRFFWSCEGCEDALAIAVPTRNEAVALGEAHESACRPLRYARAYWRAPREDDPS